MVSPIEELAEVRNCARGLRDAITAAEDAGAVIPRFVGLDHVSMDVVLDYLSTVGGANEDSS